MKISIFTSHLRVEWLKHLFSTLDLLKGVGEWIKAKQFMIILDFLEFLKLYELWICWMTWKVFLEYGLMDFAKQIQPLNPWSCWWWRTHPWRYHRLFYENSFLGTFLCYMFIIRKCWENRFFDCLQHHWRAIMFSEALWLCQAGHKCHKNLESHRSEPLAKSVGKSVLNVYLRELKYQPTYLLSAQPPKKGNSWVTWHQVGLDMVQIVGESWDKVW